MKAKKIVMAVACALLGTIGCRADSLVRIAVFNIWELSTEKLFEVDASGAGANEQVKAAASVIQRVRPDILVINEIDHDYAFPDDLARNTRQFIDAYLNRGESAIEYPHIFVAPCNTGILSGHDFDGDGVIASEAHLGTREYGNDCFGYGVYPGQYSMAVLSKYEIDSVGARTFQKLLWKDLPNHHIPPDYYSSQALEVFRLSSKSHWDVPVAVAGKRLHLFVSHPTPPVFDGPEDRNGRRNFDELQSWLHYLDDRPELYDDAGKKGGFSSDPFVILGDLNASPHEEQTYNGTNAIGQLLRDSRIQESGPFVTGRGGMVQGKIGAPWFSERNTAQFQSGNKTRIDYVLPCAAIEIIGGGVFWPTPEENAIGNEWAERASDHRLVWLDIRL